MSISSHRFIVRLGVAVGVLVLVAACSGGGSRAGARSSPAAASTRSPSVVAYSACMRAHGVPNFPDPDSSGRLPKGDAVSFGVSDSRLQTARRACRHLLPHTDGSLDPASLQQCLLAGECPQALVQRALTEMRNFARCMRTSGVPNWPDPTTGENGGPYFPLSAHGISRQQSRSAQVIRSQRACAHEMPDVGGVPVG